MKRLEQCLSQLHGTQTSLTALESGLVQGTAARRCSAVQDAPVDCSPVASAERDLRIARTILAKPEITP